MTAPIIIPDPSRMEFRDWADQVVAFSGVADVPRPPRSQDEWLDWAKRVAALPQLAIYDIPRPDSYDDWRDWATNMRTMLI